MFNRISGGRLESCMVNERGSGLRIVCAAWLPAFDSEVCHCATASEVIYMSRGDTGQDLIFYFNAIQLLTRRCNKVQRKHK